MSKVIAHLWAGSGYRFIGYQRSGQGFQMSRFGSTQQALAFAEQMHSQGFDTWFSCGLYGDGSRTADNVTSLSAFWMDLDVGADKPDKKFPSQAQALTELKQFCQDLNLPRPSLINSGYGIHVYWLLTQPVTREQWLPVAQKLKLIAAERRFKIDTARTADAASVMRLPGTSNFKQGTPAPVVELDAQPPIKFSDFQTIVNMVPTEAPARSAVTTPNEFDVPVDYPPSSAVTCTEKCQQLRAVRDAKGNVEEPLWYTSIGVWVHTEEGSEVIHEWSEGHPQYTATETDRKIAQWESKGIGPSTCAQFYGLNPEGCSGCPFKNKITSPIQLGSTPDEETPDYEADTSTGKWLTKIGKTFTIGEQGVFMASDDGPPERIMEVPFYLEKVGRVGFDDAVATVHWRTPRGTWEQSELSLTVVGEKGDMRKWLHRHSILGYYSVDKIMRFVKDFAAELNKQDDPDIIAQRFGWSGGQFLVGDRQVGKSQTKQVRISTKIPKQMSRGMTSAGSLDAWAEATRVLDKPENWVQAFTLLSSLASPLFKLCNVSGAVLSLAGPSGMGKTKGAEFAMSVWGEPSSFIHAPSSTLNAKGEILRISNNLPVVVDEVGSFGRQLGTLIYMAANGQAKERLTQSGDLRGQDVWQTLMVVTTNSPVLDYPEAIIGEAERRRVLELFVDTPITREDVLVLHDTMQENYGIAVEPYIREVIAHRDVIYEKFRQLSASYMDRPGINEVNRFGVWLVAAAQIAGALAQRAGIIRFDPMPSVQKALEFLEDNVSVTRTPMERVDELICSWANENHRRFSRKEPGKGWRYTPENEILARINQGSGRIDIPVARLKSLIAAENIPSTGLREWREQYVVDTQSTLMGEQGAYERCYQIHHPLLTSLAEGDTDESSNGD